MPSEFPPSGDPNDTRSPYIPNNYDNKFHGPVTVRTALANSFNVPAVKTLQFVGVYGDHGFIAMANRLGITSLTRNDYGLSLTLGGGDVSVLEMTGMYSVFANSGVRVPPVSILKIVDYQGKVIYQYTPPQGEQVISPEHAYLITSIISDNQARSWMFGSNSVLNLSFPVAAKTGTTNDFRDNWTLGYTPDSGRESGLAMRITRRWSIPPVFQAPRRSGPSLCNMLSRMWRRVIHPGSRVPPGLLMKPFVHYPAPCLPNGAKAGRVTEIFASDQLPLPAGQDLRRSIALDTWTGLQSSPDCNDFTTPDQIVINVTDPWAQKWFNTKDGRNSLTANDFPSPPVYAPERACTKNDPRPELAMSINDGDVISQNILTITGTANATAGFRSWQLDFSLGDNPRNWTTLAQGSQPVNNDLFFNWDVSNISGNTIALRLHIDGTNGFAEKIIHFTVALPAPLRRQRIPRRVFHFHLQPIRQSRPLPTDTPTAFPTDTSVPTAFPTETPTP